MVKFKIEIPEVPRKEIDRFGDILDKLLYRNEDDRWGWGWGSSYTNGKEGGPYFHLGMEYKISQLSLNTAIDIDAKGITGEGKFKVIINVDMPDKEYAQIEEIIKKEAAYIASILEKSSKIKS